MSSHFLALLLFSCFVSVVFANLMRDEPWEQLCLGVLLFAGLVGAAVVFSWLMYPFPL